MIGFDGGVSIGLPQPRFRGPLPPVTAEELGNPFHWLLILPASPEARARVYRQAERQQETAARIWRELTSGEGS